jgi:Na+/H+ antiporter NhaC
VARPALITAGVRPVVSAEIGIVVDGRSFVENLTFLLARFLVGVAETVGTGAEGLMGEIATAFLLDRRGGVEVVSSCVEDMVMFVDNSSPRRMG